MEIEKQRAQKFIDWTKKKIKLHFQDDEKRIYFGEREIWRASLGVNIGHEQDGKHKKFERPVLVLKQFNNEIFWGLPMTTQIKEGRYYYKIEYERDEYRVILSQLKLMSNKRLLRKIRILEKEEFIEIKEKIKNFI